MQALIVPRLHLWLFMAKIADIGHVWRWIYATCREAIYNLERFPLLRISSCPCLTDVWPLGTACAQAKNQTPLGAHQGGRGDLRFP